MNQLSKQDFKRYFDFAFEAYEYHHVNSPIGEFGDGYYRQNGVTPFIMHPLFAGALLLADRVIPENERILGYKILLLHDIIEDTNQALPDWVESEVVEGVKAMTYSKEEEASPDRLKHKIYEHSPFTKLLTLCDTLSNMYEEHVSVSKRSLWQKLVTYLTDEVEKEYGNSRVVQISRAVLANTDW